jgi:hypothetical protein
MIRKHAEMKVEVREEMRGGVGAVTVREMFTPGEITAPTRLCATLELAPGASIGSHRHDGEDEVYVITAGRPRTVNPPTIHRGRRKGATLREKRHSGVRSPGLSQAEWPVVLVGAWQNIERGHYSSASRCVGCIGRPK